MVNSNDNKLVVEAGQLDCPEYGHMTSLSKFNAASPMSKAETASGSPGSSPTESTRASSPGSPEDVWCTLSEVPEASAVPTVEVSLAKFAIKDDDVRLGQRFCDDIHIAADNVLCRQMVMRMIRMLRLCFYEHELIVLVLAVALVHLERVFKSTDKRMDDTEATSIAIVQCYNAHSYVIDEPCPLRFWHQHIFAQYCSIKMLNAVSFKLLKIMKFNLGVTNEEIEAKRLVLEHAN